jgi:hypothetical protein
MQHIFIKTENSMAKAHRRACNLEGTQWDQKGERRSREPSYLSRHALRRRKAYVGSRARSPVRRGIARSSLSRRRLFPDQKGERRSREPF